MLTDIHHTTVNTNKEKWQREREKEVKGKEEKYTRNYKETIYNLGNFLRNTNFESTKTISNFEFHMLKVLVHTYIHITFKYKNESSVFLFKRKIKFNTISEHTWHTHTKRNKGRETERNIYYIYTNLYRFTQTEWEREGEWGKSKT